MIFRQWLATLLLLRPGEGQLMSFIYVFSLFAGFGLSIGQVSSDALFFKLYGMQYLPHMYALIALVLAPASLAYAAFVDRVTPQRMFVYMMAGVSLVVALAWVVMVSTGRTGIALYFVAYGVISELLLTHLYLYVASFFDVQQAKRLLPSAMGVFLAGRIGGGFFVGLAGTTVPIEHTALIWAIILALLLAMLLWRHRGDPAHCRLKRGQATSPLMMLREGLMFTRTSRLARVTAAGMFLLVMVLSIQEYVAGRIFVEHYPDERELAAFFGWLSAWTNVGVLVMQMLLFSRLSRRYGLKTMNLVFPLTSLATLLLMAANPAFLAAVLGRINSRGILSGFRNNVAGLFYQALPGYMQGRVRALITALVLPVGLLAAALFLWLIPQDAPLAWVAGGGVVVALALLWIKLKKNHAYAESLLEMVGDSVFTENAGHLADLGALDRATARQLAAQMCQAEALPVLNSYADMLESLAPEHAGPVLLEIYADLPTRLQDALLPRIARLAPPGWEAAVWQTASQGDPHLYGTTVRLLLAARYPAVTAQAKDWLDSGGPRLRAAAAVGCLHGIDTGLSALGREVLLAMLASHRPDDYLSALGALAAMPHPATVAQVRPMLVYEDSRARALALEIWSHHPPNTAEEAIEVVDSSLFDPSPIVRAGAIGAAARLDFPALPLLDWLSRALQDPDYRVRLAAQAGVKRFLPETAAAWAEALSRRRNDFELLAVMLPQLAATDLEQREQLLRETRDGHLRHARDKLLILRHLANLDFQVDGPLELLMKVLQEEARRHLDVVLQSLGCLDPSQAMSYIRAGLASENRHLWAQAMESALQFRRQGEIFRELALLFEAEREGAELAGEPPGGLRAPATWLQWCREHGSTWLAECASYCQVTKGFAS